MYSSYNRAKEISVAVEGDMYTIAYRHTDRQGNGSPIKSHEKNNITKGV